MQYIIHGLPIADIILAYSPHSLGISFIQISKGFPIPLPALFYKPFDFHYLLLQQYVEFHMRCTKNGKDCIGH